MKSLVLLAVLVAACGGSSSTPAATPAPNSAPAAEPDGANPAPTSGDAGATPDGAAEDQPSGDAGATPDGAAEDQPSGDAGATPDGAAQDQPTGDAGTTAAAGATLDGAAIYKQYCLTCHQEDGKGMNQTLAADFTAPDGPFATKTEAELFDSVKNGKTGKIGTMPPWGGVLTDDQIKAVIHYAHETFAKDLHPPVK